MEKKRQGKTLNQLRKSSKARANPLAPLALGCVLARADAPSGLHIRGARAGAILACRLAENRCHDLGHLEVAGPPEPLRAGAGRALRVGGSVSAAASASRVQRGRPDGAPVPAPGGPGGRRGGARGAGDDDGLGRREREDEPQADIGQDGLRREGAPVHRGDGVVRLVAAVPMDGPVEDNGRASTAQGQASPRRGARSAPLGRAVEASREGVRPGWERGTGASRGLFAAVPLLGFACSSAMPLFCPSGEHRDSLAAQADAKPDGEPDQSHGHDADDDEEAPPSPPLRRPTPLVALEAPCGRRRLAPVRAPAAGPLLARLSPGVPAMRRPRAGPPGVPLRHAERAPGQRAGVVAGSC